MLGGTNGERGGCGPVWQLCPYGHSAGGRVDTPSGPLRRDCAQQHTATLAEERPPSGEDRVEPRKDFNGEQLIEDGAANILAGAWMASSAPG
jgi:hypothetical protein